jgi:hypothetical protein
VLQGCALAGINSGGNKTKQKFLLVLVGFCAAPGTERWGGLLHGVASQWAAGSGILGRGDPGEEGEDRLARVCVFVSLLLAPPPQGFSSPCCFLSPSSFSGGILLLPQSATLSVGPHRVGVPVRGLSIFAYAGPEEDAEVERSDTGPARRNAATQGPKHSCKETLIFRHNHTSVRAPRPVSDHGGPRLDASLNVVPYTASPYHFGARGCFTGQWWYVGPMGTACSSWLLFWDFAAGGAWLGTGGLHSLQ